MCMILEAMRVLVAVAVGKDLCLLLASVYHVSGDVGVRGCGCGGDVG